MFKRSEPDAPHPRREPRVPGQLSLERLEEVFSDCVDFSKRRSGSTGTAGEKQRYATSTVRPDRSG